MKTTIFSVLAMTMIATLLMSVSGTWNMAVGDDDDDEHERGRHFTQRWDNMKQRSVGVAMVSDPVYVEECGNCHIAYPPGLLTAASWRRVMLGLADHFGDNAELDADTTRQIMDYLRLNSAERSDYRRSRKFAQLPRGGAPLRITELPYFRHEHDEVPPRLIESKQVGSLSRCDACHQNAAQGVFDEDEIFIKGFGRWDD